MRNTLRKLSNMAITLNSRRKDGMPTELLRRGDLALVQSDVRPAAGLYRGDDDADDGLRPAGALDADEWWWVLHCAAPVAVRACPRVDVPDPDIEALVWPTDGGEDDEE